MTPMARAIARFSPLSPEAQGRLDAAVRCRELPKKTALLTIGQVSEEFRAVVRGSARVFCRRKRTDAADHLAVEGQFIGAVESLFTQRPSRRGIEPLEDSEVCFMVYREFHLLCDSFHELERVGHRMAIFGMLEGQRRTERIRFLTARERHRELERLSPGISSRAPLRQPHASWASRPSAWADSAADGDVLTQHHIPPAA